MKEISKSEILIITLIIFVIGYASINVINPKLLINKINLSSDDSNILYETDFEDEINEEEIYEENN